MIHFMCVSYLAIIEAEARSDTHLVPPRNFRIAVTNKRERDNLWGIPLLMAQPQAFASLDTGPASAPGRGRHSSPPGSLARIELVHGLKETPYQNLRERSRENLPEDELR